MDNKINNIKRLLGILSYWKVTFILAALFLFSNTPSYALDITLKWDDSTSSDVTGYKVYYKKGSMDAPYDGTDLGQGASPIDVGGVTRYSLTGLSATTFYVFAVTAVDDQGLESEYSNIVDTRAPQITSLPTATYISDTIAVIEWSTDKLGDSVVESGTSFEYTLTGVTTRNRYEAIAVQADTLMYSDSGVSWTPNSLAGLELKFNVTGNSTFTISSNTAYGITIDTADGYITDANPTGGGVTNNVPFEILRTAHSVKLTGLTGSTSYRFRVMSTDAIGSGPDRETGDNNPSSYFTFVTAGSDDQTAPVISAPTVTSTTNNTATIQWTTDEPATSLVQYGLDSENLWEDYSSGVTDLGMTTSHSVTLIGLTSGTSYYCRVGSTDPSGNGPSKSNEVNFLTSTSSDNTAPQITSAPSVTSITNNSAVVTWITDENGTGVVEYGTSTSYGFTKTISVPLVANHSVTLTGLNSSTLYHFRASSTDAAGNGPDTSGSDNNPSSDYTFTTAAAPDTTAPVITGGPTAGSITNNQATIQWTTDEASNSQVQYGLSYGISGTSDWGKYQVTVNNSSPVTSHSITISGLSGNTQYYFRVGSTDTLNNGPTVSSQVSFTTAPDPDTTPPYITSAPTVTAITNTTATIEWETNEVGSSLVKYGTTKQNDWNNYTLSRSVAGPTAAHSVTLTGLFSGTTYYFQVGSIDPAGNGPDDDPDDNNPFSEVRFSTLSTSDTTAPQITSPPTVISRTDTTAVIQYYTDEPGNSIVRYGTSQSNWGGYPPANETTDGRMVTNHTVTLTGLSSGTSYYFRASSIDANGIGPYKSATDNNPSAEVNFLTGDAADTTAPQITSPPTVIAKTDTTATIQWATDEPSNSLVQYGVSQSGTSDWGKYPYSQSDASMLLTHTITITGVTSTNTYNFRVGSADASGNGPDLNPNPGNNPSEEMIFTPSGVSDTTPPLITSPPTVTAKTDTTATIEWNTDEPSNSVVQYGTMSGVTWDVYDSIKSNADLTTTHTVTLISLTADTTYYFRVGSTDISGNGPGSPNTVNNPSNEVSFKTDTGDDTTAPMISGVSVATVTDTSAVIQWSTDEPSTSLVQYGEDSSGTTPWGSYISSKNDGNMGTNHTVTLTGLTLDTPYEFRVGSIDASGNGPDLNNNITNPSGASTFQTSATSDHTSPVISRIIEVSVTDKSAVIQWTTDELSNSAVQYGEDPSTWDNYPNIRTITSMVINHSVTITGLSAISPYYYRVCSTDISGNSNYSGEETFNTAAAPDTTAPVIDNIAVASKSGTTAIITWTTDEPSNSEVRYGTGSVTWTSYQSSKNDGAMVTNHSITLTDLTPGTTYNYRVGSTDAFSNSSNEAGPSSFDTDPPDADPPSIIKWPVVNHANDYIDITYSESFMKNASGETNYSFSPTMLFDTVGGSDDITYIGSDTYRLFMSSIADYTIYTLTVSNITDEAGNAVSPASITINDDDSDNMADDWEDAYGLDSGVSDHNLDKDGDGLSNIDEFRGGGTLALNPDDVDTDSDGMDDYWEVTYGTDPKTDDSNGDLDSDSWTNLQEYNSGTDPSSASSLPIEVKEAMPPSGTTVPNNTSFALRIQAVKGVDITINNNLIFYIDDGVGQFNRNLGNAGVTAIKITPAPDTGVTNFWAQYDRSADTKDTYTYGNSVGVSVYVTDTGGSSLDSQTYNYIVESQDEHDAAQSNLPSSTTGYESGTSDFLIIEVVNTGTTDSPLEGATMVFNLDDGGVTPYFGPIDAIPALDISGVAAVGIPVNLQPPRVFPSGITVFIPCPGYTVVSALYIYGYDGSTWKAVCNSSGTVLEGGEGWMIPGSRVNTNNGNPSGITIRVYHFSGLIAGEPPAGGSDDADEGTPGGSSPEEEIELAGGGGGGCFISTLK